MNSELGRIFSLFQPSCKTGVRLWFASQQNGPVDDRLGSFASLWALRLDVRACPVSDRDSDLPSGAKGQLATFLTTRRRPLGRIYWPQCHCTAFMPDALPDVRVAGQ
jgi:hypothetical protein